MKTEFTPGPWMFAEGKFNCDPRSGGIGSITTKEVGPWYVATIENAPGHEANAHLIAAAPDMYAALEHLWECRDCGTEAWADCEGGRAALAALKKARGEQP